MFQNDYRGVDGIVPVKAERLTFTGNSLRQARENYSSRSAFLLSVGYGVL